MMLEMVYELDKLFGSLCAKASSSRRFAPTAPARARARARAFERSRQVVRAEVRFTAFPVAGYDFNDVGDGV